MKLTLEIDLPPGATYAEAGIKLARIALSLRGGMLSADDQKPDGETENTVRDPYDRQVAGKLRIHR